MLLLIFSSAVKSSFNWSENSLCALGGSRSDCGKRISKARLSFFQKNSTKHKQREASWKIFIKIAYKFSTVSDDNGIRWQCKRRNIQQRISSTENFNKPNGYCWKFCKFCLAAFPLHSFTISKLSCLAVDELAHYNRIILLIAKWQFQSWKVTLGGINGLTEVAINFIWPFHVTFDNKVLKSSFYSDFIENYLSIHQR